MKLAAIAIWSVIGLASLDACSETQTAPSALSVSAILPSTGPVGTTVTVEGSGFAPSGNVVKFGIG